MSALTIELLHAFEKLPEEDREEFLKEVLRREQPRAQEINLPQRGISKEQAEDLRNRLKTFAEDWDRPEASVYDENPSR
jgi:hypothetical protein